MRLGYRKCFHRLYDENLNTKTLWKARWLFGKTKWLFRKLEWHPGKTGILTNMDNTMKEKCPQGVCNGEGEYITHLICSYGNNLDMYPASTCDYGRKFNSLGGSRIHMARWCEQRNSPAGECKSNDGPMNQVYPHSIHEPIADHQRPGDISCKPRI